MPNIEALSVKTLAEMQEALSVRRRVFIEEQGVSEVEEIDHHDDDPATVTTCQHALIRVDGAPVATGRLVFSDETGRPHIGRVAVVAEQRGKGFGRAVMLVLHQLARERGLYDITLGAQLHAIGFYERLGYVARGGIFLDAGIEHRWMDLTLER